MRRRTGLGRSLWMLGGWARRVCVVVGCACVATAVAAADRPNIVLIVSDDQGYNDLGLLGNGIQTPALDRLAREGTRLTNFYVAWPACTPSRGALLTGRYPQRNGLYDMIRNEAPDYGKKYQPAEYEVTLERIVGMDTREVLVSQLLKQAGYRTAAFGKWDGGSHQRFLPTSRGFDEFYGFVNTGIDYITHERYGVPSMYRNNQPCDEDKGTYCTFLFEREAVRFANDCLQESDTPFFLYLPFNAPHGSSALDPRIRSTVQAPESFQAMYPPVDEETREVTYRYGGTATVVTSAARQRDYRAAVTCMDAAIGKLLDLLRKRGVLDNTIVIFFSDNGGSGGADNAPLRGRKGQMWEGGIRVPCLVRWPAGGVPAGAVSDAFLTSLEILPSLLAAAGVGAPEGVVLDGDDWWPTLRGEAASPRHRMFWKRRDQEAARVGDWKLVRLGAEAARLYNLRSDVAERDDLAAAEPERLQELERAFSEWQQEMAEAPVRGPFRDH